MRTTAPPVAGFAHTKERRDVIRDIPVYGEGERFLKYITVPAWFLNSDNPPKDRGKRGQRTRVGGHKKGKCRFDVPKNLDGSRYSHWPCGHRSNPHRK